MDDQFLRKHQIRYDRRIWDDTLLPADRRLRQYYHDKALARVLGVLIVAMIFVVTVYAIAIIP